jgi:Mn2+/Fe2+ NRAMP family transporter
VTRSSRLSAIGPAILLTATSVGAGDILTGSLAGAQVGMAALWAVPAGVILKWTLTEGIARWQMATGTTLLEGWVTRLGRWIQWVFFGYLLLFSLVTGGMLASACGVAGAALVPLADPQTSRFVWGATHSLTGLTLVWFGGYALLKKVLAVYPTTIPSSWVRAPRFSNGAKARRACTSTHFPGRRKACWRASVTPRS